MSIHKAIPFVLQLDSRCSIIRNHNLAASNENNMKKISELSEKEKDSLLIQASELMIDYFSVKNDPEQVRKLFNRDIAKELKKLTQ
jgi:hypothetical protein